MTAALSPLDPSQYMCLPPEATAVVAPQESCTAEVQQTRFDELDAETQLFESRYEDVKIQYYNNRFYALSLQRFKSIWQDPRFGLQPPNFQAKVLQAIGVTERRMNSHDAAFDFFGRALQVTPKDPMMMCDYAEAGLKRSGSSETFDRYVQEASKMPSTSARTYICLAEYARASTTLTQAQALANNACRVLSQLGRDNPAARCVIANIRKWGESAEWHLADKWTESDVYETELQNWIKAKPQDAVPLRRLGEYYFKGGHYGLAMESLAQAIELGVQIMVERAPMLVQLARAQYATGNFATARQTWDQLQAEPQYQAELHYGRGMLALQDQDFEQAMRELKVAISLDSETLEYHAAHQLASQAQIVAFLAPHDYSRIKGLDSLDIFEQGLAMSQAHLQQYPADHLIMHSLIWCNWRVQEARGRPDLMLVPEVAALQKVAEVPDEQAPYFRGLYRVYVALSYSHAGKLLKNQTGKQEQVTRYFGDAERILKAELNRRDDIWASDEGDKILQMNLNEAVLSLGWVYFDQERYADAEQAFKTLIVGKYIDGSVWPKAKVLVKELMEAYRGVGNVYDVQARNHYGAEVPKLNVATELAQQAVTAHMMGIMIESEFSQHPQRSLSALEAAASQRVQAAIANGGFSSGDLAYIDTIQPGQAPVFKIWPELVAATPDKFQQKATLMVSDGYHTYLDTLFKGVSVESVFNLGTAQYWWGKILLAQAKKAEEVKDPQADAIRQKSVQAYQKAGDYFSLVIAQAPHYPEALRFRGYVRMVLNDYEACRNDLEQALKEGTLYPVDARSKWIMALTHQIQMVEGSGANAKLQATPSQIANYNSYLVNRVNLAVTNAFESPMLLAETLQWAQVLGRNTKICVANSPQKELLQKLADTMAHYGHNKAQFQLPDEDYQKLQVALKPCLEYCVKTVVENTPTRR